MKSSFRQPLPSPLILFHMGPSHWVKYCSSTITAGRSGWSNSEMHGTAWIMNDDSTSFMPTMQCRFSTSEIGRSRENVRFTDSLL